MTLKNILFDAVINGDLGSFDDHGAIVTLKEFEQKFPHIKAQSIREFLPSVTFETDLLEAHENRFLTLLKEDVYRLHTDDIEEYSRVSLINDSVVRDSSQRWSVNEG